MSPWDKNALQSKKEREIFSLLFGEIKFDRFKTKCLGNQTSVFTLFDLSAFLFAFLKPSFCSL